jgi:hydrogenase expression/formation protein HypC
MRLVAINGDSGLAESGGVRRRVELAFVPNVKIGEWVLVHAGFAITIVDEQEAAETLRLLQEGGFLAG